MIMPRTARIDAPGVLHHVMIRGIERRNIFHDNNDREDFIERLEVLWPATQTKERPPPPRYGSYDHIIALNR